MPSAPTAGSCGNALGRGKEYSVITGSGERGAESRHTTTAKPTRSRGERVIGRSFEAERYDSGSCVMMWRGAGGRKRAGCRVDATPPLAPLTIRYDRGITTV